MNTKIFENSGFELIEYYEFNRKYHSYFYLYKDFLIIIDDNFDLENNKDYFFSYSLYCDNQNKYMKKYDKVLRFNFMINEVKLLNEIIDITSKEILEFDVTDSGGTLDKSHLDNSYAEKLFEDAFLEVYGNGALSSLQKEVEFSLPNGKTGSADFVVETKTGNYSIEANGITYHHPLLVGKEQYERQLEKQNTLCMFGFKTFRFSSENLRCEDQIECNIKDYLGKKEEFIPKPILYSPRGFKLYRHQTEILQNLDNDRLNGKNVSLIVLPTGTGKSEIVITDLSKDYIKSSVKNILIMVPNTAIKNDWSKRIREKSLEEKYFKKYHFDILCYPMAYKITNEVAPDYYDYILCDEAHHSQGAVIKKTIKYFNPKYLIGLTATPDRTDEKKLEEIFGDYYVNMNLNDAIENGVVPKIRPFRLISNIDLSEVRYDGKDYNYADLEKNLIIDSRNILIAKTINKYFKKTKGFYKQGIIFCVNKDHCKRMAKCLNDIGILAAPVYGGNNKNNLIFAEYQEKKIQFLCSCQLISEGWDSPQTEVIVMARPTLSKVLYLQQIGRGLRHYTGKECLYVIDVVDNYSAKLTPWSYNSLFKIPSYSPFDVANGTNEFLKIIGLNEKEVRIQEIDIFSFEDKYGGYLSLEEAARKLYIGTNTLKSWNDKNDYASLHLAIGNRINYYFSDEDIEKIRKDKNLKIHNDETIFEDFNEFLVENTLTFSFKLVFIILAIKLANDYGEINLTELTNKYSEFYKNRINLGLPVDKKNCIYNLEFLNDFEKIKRNMLENPFEKFERKRFIYLSKDLNIIAFNPILWKQMTNQFKKSIIKQEYKYLEEYYNKYGGLNYEYKF